MNTVWVACVATGRLCSAAPATRYGKILDKGLNVLYVFLWSAAPSARCNRIASAIRCLWANASSDPAGLKQQQNPAKIVHIPMRLR